MHFQQSERFSMHARVVVDCLIQEAGWCSSLLHYYHYLLIQPLLHLCIFLLSFYYVDESYLSPSNPFTNYLIFFCDTVNTTGSLSFSVNCQYFFSVCIINVHNEKSVFSSTCKISQLLLLKRSHMSPHVV